jgi:hypothetical protein
MAAHAPARSPAAYPANARPALLCQVDHGRRLIYVLEAQLDSDDPVLDVFLRSGRYAKQKVLRTELGYDGNDAIKPVEDCDDAHQPSLFAEV